MELGIAKWIFKCLPKVRAAPGGTESGLRSVEIGTPYGTSFKLVGPPSAESVDGKQEISPVDWMPPRRPRTSPLSWMQ